MYARGNGGGDRPFQPVEKAVFAFSDKLLTFSTTTFCPFFALAEDFIWNSFIFVVCYPQKNDGPDRRPGGP